VFERRLPRWSAVIVLALVWTSPLTVLSARSVAAQEASLVIETIPPLEGVAFRLGKQRFETDADGVAQVASLEPGAYELKANERQLMNDQTRVSFEAWSDGVVEASRMIDVGGALLLQAGFNVDHLVTESFRTAAGETLSPESIGSFEVVDDTGTATTYQGSSRGLAGPTAQQWERFPPGTRWLRATRVFLGQRGLTAEEASYRVRSIVVDDERVPGSVAPFLPRAGAEWVIASDPEAAGAPTGGILALLAVFVVGLVGLVAFGRPLLARIPALRQREAAGSVDGRAGREYVRVTLRDGRVVEGWKTHVPGGSDAEALTVDVTSVRSPDGEELASDPLDSFILPSQIKYLETPEDSPQLH
jgi:hypothetical protein